MFKIASNRAEREAAYRLVYQTYLRAGLTRPNPVGMRVTPYHLLPTTTLFVGKMVTDTVISTVSLVADSDHGLPMESTYPELVLQRRLDGLRVGEVTCLADIRGDVRNFLPSFCQLVRLLAQFARQQDLDQLLIMTHPRHARFYSRYMGFSAIGELKKCSHVHDSLAIALCLDFHRIDEQQPRFYDAVFGDPVESQRLEPQYMTYDEREYF